MEQQLLAYSPSMPRMLLHKLVGFVNHLHSDSQAQIKLGYCYHHISLLLFKLSLELGLCRRGYLKGDQVITTIVLRSWRLIIFALLNKKEKEKEKGVPCKSYSKKRVSYLSSIAILHQGHNFISVNMLIALSLSFRDNVESLALLVQLIETITETAHLMMPISIFIFQKLKDNNLILELFTCTETVQDCQASCRITEV